jgi:uncharacterized metal-binding protein YceD (DUF177 family)
MRRPPEFSRRVRADSVGPEGLRERLRAAPAERAALAQRFGIESVDRLEATLDLAAEPGGTIRVRGHLAADVTQVCVVTFDPVAQHIEEPVELRFVPAGMELAEDDPGAPDEIPMSRGDVLDLGEAVAEQLALALDPYPRAEGAELPPEARESGSPGPFTALAKLRRR